MNPHQSFVAPTRRRHTSPAKLKPEPQSSLALSSPDQLEKFFARERERTSKTFFSQVGAALLENAGLAPYLPYISDRVANATLSDIYAMMTEEEFEESQQFDNPLPIYRGVSLDNLNLLVWTPDRAIAAQSPFLIPGVGPAILPGYVYCDDWALKLKDGIPWVITSSAKRLSLMPA